MSKLKKHNKIKNTGILFELLTRQITVDVINNTKKAKAIDILKEFFNEKTQLGKEYQLYKVLIEKKYKDSNQAKMLVEAVIKNRRKLSSRKLKNEKFNLIKIIKENYDVNAFFNARINDYKILASIYNIFENTHIEPVEQTDSQITLIEHICKHTNKKQNKKDLVEGYDKESDDVRLLAYQLLVDKFNKKYSKLNESQKTLLREYINNISNTNSLREFIDTEVLKVKAQLKKHIKKIDDKITKIKLAEAIKHTDTAIGGKFVKDSHVVSLMRYYELIKELGNVHKSK